MFNWLKRRLLRRETARKIARLHFTKRELVEIRKTCHKKDRIDDLVEIVGYWINENRHHSK